jgi:hypothetical protein
MGVHSHDFGSTKPNQSLPDHLGFTQIGTKLGTNRHGEEARRGAHRGRSAGAEIDLQVLLRREANQPTPIWVSVRPAAWAASAFCLKPPIGSTRPRSVTSPVMPTVCLTGRPDRSEAMSVRRYVGAALFTRDAWPQGARASGPPVANSAPLREPPLPWESSRPLVGCG